MDERIRFLQRASLGAILLTTVICWIPHVTYAQAWEISGTVVDSTDGTPLPGVNVVVKGTTRGTATNAEGAFQLTVPSPQDTLVFSFVGYRAKTVPVAGRSTLDVALAPRVSALEDVVVVGYGTQQREDVSSAISMVSSAEIEQRNATDPRRALQGLVPGLAIVDAGGAPGTSSISMMIRGRTTIGGTHPLVLVDGIERDLWSVDPQNIKSISVLKDAAATAIYGSRAASGVILITTKGAQPGELSVSYDGYVGIDQVSQKPDRLGTEAYLRMLNEIARNGGQSVPYTEEDIQGYLSRGNSPEEMYKYPPLWPWFDAVFQRGFMQYHHLAVSGGTDRISARMSFRYADREGIIPHYNENIKGGILSIDLRATDRINLSGKLGYQRFDLLQPAYTDGVYWYLWHAGGGGVPRYPDGTYGLSRIGANPLMAAQRSGDWERTTDRLIANLEGEAQLLKNLTFTMQFGGQLDLRRNSQFSREYVVQDWKTGEVVKRTGENNLWENRRRRQRWTWRNLLNYELELNEHQIGLLAGFEQTWERTQWLQAYRQQFYNNQLHVLGAGSKENWQNDGGESAERLRSVLGRVRYSYDDRYILTASARYDGSSKFYGAGNQYSFFPSFSAAWRISEERFWEPLQSVISSLKLRGSWGQSGYDSVGLYTFFQGINLATNYSFNNQIVRTASPSGLVNYDLTWETNTQWDIGLDAELWNGLLSLTFDYWHKRTEGILLNLPIPEVIGFDAPPQNAGIVDNAGWEVAITHRNSVSSDFNYSIRANLSNFHNEVVDLARTGPHTPGLNVRKVGEPLNALWGYKVLGFFQSEEEIARSPTIAEKENTFPGDLKYADLNGDGEIDPDDKMVVGTEDPHYSFGIATNMRFKNFDLSFLIQGVGKQDRMLTGAAHECGNWGNIILEVCGDYWTQENRDATVPRPQAFSGKNTAISTFWILDASYVKLKNVQLGYTLPSDVIRMLGVSKLRIYVQGSDLLTLSEAKKWGIDPEAPSGRINYYPQSSRYTVGVNLTF